MPEKILALTKQVSTLATSKVDEIRKITQMTRILSINASIEAARAGDSGAGFAVVAEAVGTVSKDIEAIAERLHSDLGVKVKELNEVGLNLIANIKGTRLADLALNMIDVIDRNLYERSCDVRWWATDSSVISCASKGAGESRSASDRLAVILESYTVYLDIWIAGQDGTVLSHGRPKQYPSVAGTSVKEEEWFRRAMKTRDGGDFVACDIAASRLLGGAQVATYATAIRENGAKTGKPIGALAIFFDWEKQSQDVVSSVRLTDAEKQSTRCLILNSNYRVIASSAKSDDMDHYPLKASGESIGTFVDDSGRLVGFARTPGYETYKGLGWYGALVQSPPEAK